MKSWIQTAVYSLILTMPALLYGAPADDSTGISEEFIDTIQTLEMTEEVTAEAVSSPETADTMSADSSADTMLVLDEDDELDEDGLPPIEKMPELTEFIEAAYPPEIYRQGIEGSVLMNLLVNDSGIVESVAVVMSLHPVLDSSAMAAARRFVFTPAIAGGVPVTVLLQYEYRFSLQTVVEKVTEYVNFSGIVLERGTRTPLAGALIVLDFIDTLSDTALDVPFNVYIGRIGRFEGQYLEDGRLVTVTDSMGVFSFNSLPACTISVKIPVPGYEDFQAIEVMTPGQATEVVYRIRRVSYSDYEIVVYGKSEEKEVAKRELNITEVRKIPGFGGDAVKVVQALPGVARPTFGLGQIIVRGRPTWDSRFLLDGVTIPQLYHFGGVKSTYNSDALASVELYPGGYNTRYGGSIGGVIEIKGREAKNDRWYGKINTDFNDVSFMVEGPVGEKVSVLGTARRSVIGDILGWAIENIDYLDIPVAIAPFYWDYVARVDVNASRNHHLFLTLFGSKDRFELIVPQMRGGSQEIDEISDRVDFTSLFHMGLLGWDWKIGEKLDNELRLGITMGESRGSIFGFARWDAAMWDIYLRNELAWSPTERLTWKLGADIELIPYEQNTAFPIVDGTIVTDSLDDLFGVVGAYLNLEWKPLEGLSIIPGIRYDYFPELIHDGSVIPVYWDYKSIDVNRGPSGEPSLRLTARYTFLKNHTFKGAFGNYSQTPQPMGVAINKTIGEPGLPTTKSRHIVLGYEWRITDLIFADIQGYYNKQWDIPRFATSTDVVADQGVTWLADEEAKSYGIEVLLRHDQGRRFFGWIAYTLARSEQYDKNDEDWFLFDSDQTHNLQFVGNVRLRKNWEIGTRIRYVSGNPYTPVVDRVYDLFNRMYFPDYGEKNSLRNDPFFQVDVRFDKKFVFRRWMMGLYIDLQNLSYFVYKSPEMLINNYDFTELQPISSPFFPSLGLTAEF